MPDILHRMTDFIEQKAIKVGVAILERLADILSRMMLTGLAAYHPGLPVFTAHNICALMSIILLQRPLVQIRLL